MPRIEQWETLEQAARRLGRMYEAHTEMLWEEYVDELEIRFSIPRDRARQLLEDEL